MILYRHCDPRFPFLWETAGQPPARWHDLGEGPVHYFADTPDGAWAELLRHEGITGAEDLAGVRRALWAVEVPHPPTTSPALPPTVLQGGVDSYDTCRKEARRLRARGVQGFVAPSAALTAGGASGWVVAGGLRPGPRRDGLVYVLFGPRPQLVGWMATEAGQPSARILDRVRHLPSPSTPGVARPGSRPGAGLELSGGAGPSPLDRGPGSTHERGSGLELRGGG